MTINERVHLIIKEVFNGNKSAFAKCIDVRPTTIANFTREAKPASPSSDILEKMIINIPNLNADWLLTGKGDMLKKGHISSNNSHVIQGGNNNISSSVVGYGNSIIGDGNNQVSIRKGFVDNESPMIASLEKKIIELETRIKEKDNFIKMLLDNRDK